MEEESGSRKDREINPGATCVWDCECQWSQDRVVVGGGVVKRGCLWLCVGQWPLPYLLPPSVLCLTYYLPLPSALHTADPVFDLCFIYQWSLPSALFTTDFELSLTYHRHLPSKLILTTALKVTNTFSSIETDECRQCILNCCCLEWPDRNLFRQTFKVIEVTKSCFLLK